MSSNQQQISPSSSHRTQAWIEENGDNRTASPTWGTAQGPTGPTPSPIGAPMFNSLLPTGDPPGKDAAPCPNCIAATDQDKGKQFVFTVPGLVIPRRDGKPEIEGSKGAGDRSGDRLMEAHGGPPWQGGERADRPSRRFGRTLLHAFVLGSLFAADASFAGQHCPGDACSLSEAQAIEWLGVPVLLLYAVAAAWLLVLAIVRGRNPGKTQTQPIEGVARRSLWRKGWLLLAVLQTSVALASSWWREAVAGSSDAGSLAIRATCLAGVLQLVLVTLRPGVLTWKDTVLLSAVSGAVLLIAEVLEDRPVAVVVDQALVHASMCVVCVLATDPLLLEKLGWRDRHWEEPTLQEKLSKLRLIFWPISGALADEPTPQVTTKLEQLVSRLRQTQDNVHQELGQSNLGKFLQQVLSHLLVELSLLDRVTDANLDGASPMMRDFVQQMLQQGADHTPGAVDAVDQDETDDMEHAVTMPNIMDAAGEGTPSICSVESNRLKRQSRASTPRQCFANSRPGGRSAGGAVLLELNGGNPQNGNNTALDLTGSAFTSAEPRKACRPHSAPLAGTADRAGMPKVGTRSGFQARSREKPSSSRFASYDRAVDALVAPLKCKVPELVPHVMTDELQEALSKELGMWRFDMIKLCAMSGGQPLAAVGNAAIRNLSMSVSSKKLEAFLQNVEARYHGNPYHNSIHGADVLNNMAYFLNLMDGGARKRCPMEPIEKLAALTAAGAHDVGHNGKSNPYHITSRTPLAMLYNDQSCLENMHCTIVFSVLQVESCDFLEELDKAHRATFRSIVTQMILDTDLSKHVSTISRFRQMFLHKVEDTQDAAGQEPPKLDTAHRKELLAIALKCSDVAHSTKPFDLHVVWTLRINAEFFAQGDSERSLGLPCSPFCDRNSLKVAESQRGFFDFIVSPLFNAVDEYLKSYRLRMEVVAELEKNKAFWKNYQGQFFDYSDPSSNVDMLRRVFSEWDRARREDAEEPPDAQTGSEGVCLPLEKKPNRRATITEGTSQTPNLSSKAPGESSLPLTGFSRRRSRRPTDGQLWTSENMQTG